MSDEQDERNGVRRRFTAQQKVAVLKEHLVEKVPVSEVCDKHGLNPTAFYRWQKEFFENGAAAFEGRAPKADGRARQLQERVEKLSAKLARKDEVIAEVMEEAMRLKKSLGEA
jgi:transposase-like protein